MSVDRVYVGVIFQGVPHYYQRDEEYKTNSGQWKSRPFVVAERSQAAKMSESEARVFIRKLLSLGVKNAWIEDARDGHRIEVASESQQFGEDTREPVAATLDDENSPGARWYIVRPTYTPDGPKWFIKIAIRGYAEPCVIYANTPLGVLQRAEDVEVLRFATKYERPEPQLQTSKVPVIRRRPGDER